VLIENLQKSHDTLKEQTTEVITRLQIENKELNMKLSLTQREGVQVESQTVAASRASVDTMQKSLIHAETELTELRKKYQEAVSVTVPKLESELGDALRRINELTKTNAQLTGTLAEKQDEVGMWKKKFAVTEKERETLIEGWKDIVSTAGGSTNVKPKKPSGKSVWKM
jgi:vacuolar-type H+-ATPase subunit D/Vma8